MNDNTPPPKPPFFTWVLQELSKPEDVPERMRVYMRVLWLNGTSEREIADTFKMPVEWVEDFVRDTSRTTKPH
ncbi:hypothetical protein CWO91_16655 [Bradyrhizobium genosp. SA-3]|uniref:hypothetical protein n=1 Tax=Bradyrhizobium genosp. SA-3 TaxID=508868 RepID=UPI0010288817|nr:hypothetical protein [Bradyrhizobium genosp. SA-3]RZN09658.1 hypothetical protein CWO91_16655 [Bradyrhizobium genosp. SA-3]